MIRINLPTGKTINVSTIEYLSLLDEEVSLFFETCVADDLGIYIENPFSDKSFQGQIMEDSSEEDF